MEIDENAPGNLSQQAVTRTTDNETGHDPRRDQVELPLPPDDEAPVDNDMTDVAASNSLSSEHPGAVRSGRADDPEADPQVNDQGQSSKEARDMPASDPEAGA